MLPYVAMESARLLHLLNSIVGISRTSSGSGGHDCPVPAVVLLAVASPRAAPPARRMFRPARRARLFLATRAFPAGGADLPMRGLVPAACLGPQCGRRPRRGAAVSSANVLGGGESVSLRQPGAHLAACDGGGRGWPGGAGSVRR